MSELRKAASDAVDAVRAAQAEYAAFSELTAHGVTFTRSQLATRLAEAVEAVELTWETVVLAETFKADGNQ